MTTALVVLADGTGIGLEVIVPARSLADPGESVRLFTSLHMASDGALLTGFETPEELRVFRALLNVNGVGPRMAVRVLSTHPARRIYEALDQEDPKPFQVVTGIGARPANRIILELRGKLVPEDTTPAETSDDESAREVLRSPPRPRLHPHRGNHRPQPDHRRAHVRRSPHRRRPA